MNFVIGLIVGLYFGISPHVCDVMKPRPFVVTSEWALANVTLPSGSEIKGKFRLDLFPHAKEPLDCFDDPTIRQISLQWAARLGKTSIAQVCLAKQADTRPAPMAFSDADQKSVQRVLKRLWKILDKVPGLQGRLPPRHLRSNDMVEAVDFMIHGAWSGSSSTAADYAAMVVVMNEIDKMSKKKSAEADFAIQMKDRALGFARHKILAMSTPSRKGSSRIETLRLEGDNRRRVVPCPFCNFFQVLIEGNGRDPGGLRWKKGPNGHSDAAIAEETAWYECIKCLREIRDEHRYEMLNAGVWVPEGMDVDSRGRLIGKALRRGDHASFGPLSSLYSLLPSMNWGFLAKESVESRRPSSDGRPREKRRRFVNSILGETWDDAPPENIQHELAARLCIPGQLQGICPSWVRFLTRGCDAGGHEEGQSSVMDSLWWEVWGWGQDGRCALIDYGVSSPEELGEQLPSKTNPNGIVYPHEDGGAPLPVSLTLIDSSNFTTPVYQYCRKYRNVFPVKGSSKSDFPTAYKLTGMEVATSVKQAEMQLKLGGLVLFIANSQQSQEWIEGVVRGNTKPTDPFGVSLPEMVGSDFGFLNQLTAEYPVDERNENGYIVQTWKKRGKNEWRDAARYAWVAAFKQTNNGRYFANLPPRSTLAAAQAAAAAARPRTPSNHFTTPDGRPYLVSDRR